MEIKKLHCPGFVSMTPPPPTHTHAAHLVDVGPESGEVAGAAGADLVGDGAAARPLQRPQELRAGTSGKEGGLAPGSEGREGVPNNSE